MHNARPARHRLRRDLKANSHLSRSPRVSVAAGGDLSVFRVPLRAGATHIVCLGPIPGRLIGHCAPPSIRCGHARLPKREGNDVRHFRELMSHLKSPIGGESSGHGIRIRGGILLVVINVEYRCMILGHDLERNSDLRLAVMEPLGTKTNLQILGAVCRVK